jgi:3-oxoacyl-[acyl-carrier protein] reductase
MFRLDGKIALVTGGSRGIGRACCEVLAGQGATVVVNYRKGEDAARAVVDSVLARGGKADVSGFDVAESAAADAAIDGIIKRHGRIDILVANAGIAIDALLLRQKDEDFTTLWRTNVLGAVNCARAASRSMMRSRWGRIVFMSSVVGEMGNVGQTAYAATKAALLGAARSIAREYAGRNVTANVIAPGYIDTDMTGGMSTEHREQLLKLVPLGRIGSAQDVAAACAYLVSEEAGYVSGQVLRVNGGMHM